MGDDVKALYLRVRQGPFPVRVWIRHTASRPSYHISDCDDSYAEGPVGDTAYACGKIRLQSRSSDYWYITAQDPAGHLWQLELECVVRMAGGDVTVRIAHDADGYSAEILQSIDDVEQVRGGHRLECLTVQDNLRQAQVYRPANGWTVDGVLRAAGVEPGGSRSRAPTPGNVGVCLSGGGSRALCAGMGQLRALKALGVLGQVKALSCVSGGAWLGGAYTFLGEASGRDHVSDDDFLGQFVADPGALDAASLGAVHRGNAGRIPTSGVFSIGMLEVHALLLVYLGLNWDMAWQALIGIHVLKPYGLFVPDQLKRPQSGFSFDPATLQRITGRNALLGQRPWYTVTEGPDRLQRPYFICNFSMRVAYDGAVFLVPAQSTPVLTGVMGKPAGATAQDGSGQAIGGGAVDSFAFNSSLQYLSTDGGMATVSQNRLWSLADAVGTSSSALAAKGMDLYQDIRVGVEGAADRLRDWLIPGIDWIAPHLPEDMSRRVRDMATWSADELAEWVADKAAMIPRYRYWGLNPASPGREAALADFVDGGLLENTGLAGLLAYADIDSAIVFVNGEDGLQRDANGFIQVDSQLPPLFGMRPYTSGIGYRPYADGRTDHGMEYWMQKSQLFGREHFQPLLDGLWQASAGGTEPAVFLQELVPQANDWLGIARREEPVRIFWVYLTAASAWNALLQPATRDLVAATKLPNYSTLSTELSAIQVNALAHFTSWCVNRHADTIRALFQ